MSNNVQQFDRRRFLAAAFPLGTIACLGCTGWAAQALQPGRKDTFLENPGMSAEEIYSFFYGMFIPVLQSLGRDMGQERFIRTMTRAAEENTAQMISSMAKDLPQRDMKAFSSFLRGVLDSPLYKQAFPAKIVQSTDTVLELRYDACLPAKLFRAMNAADIGYALECSGTPAAARAFNPRITASNLKNMMRGDGYCIERFTLGALPPQPIGTGSKRLSPEIIGQGAGRTGARPRRPLCRRTYLVHSTPVDHTE